MAFIYIFVLTKEYWRDGWYFYIFVLTPKVKRIYILYLLIVVDSESKKKSMAFI
jgi:hypothetical protein